jgi:hypothetical protein
MAELCKPGYACPIASPSRKPRPSVSAPNANRSRPTTAVPEANLHQLRPQRGIREQVGGVG